ncbi:mechanosensitive ion channel family protein [bacterium]|nr:mechanosensitive ion channel family protein [bacterium]MBU1884920.1 mechanosensitive ion channel family protein [bacterium]
MQKLLLVFFFLFSISANAADNKDNNKTDPEFVKQKQHLVQEYMAALSSIESDIPADSVWMKNYSSYLTSIEVKNNLAEIKAKISQLSKNNRYGKNLDELSALRSKENILSSQMLQLKGKDTTPFAELLTPPEIGDIPPISNPIDIFTGYSFIKQINNNHEDYIMQKVRLKKLIDLLDKKKSIYENLIVLQKDKKTQEALDILKKQLDRFTIALDTIDITDSVYKKRIEVIEININKKIEEQIYKLTKIGIIVVVFFVISFLIKLIIKKYITDNERFYTANKIITFTNFTLILLIVFFNYIENVGYLVTILGFASAGIAIAMKDWFMSLLGWLVIVFGGSIHVGDRIRVDMDGMLYIGDVLDISLLRITILEDITLTSFEKNRRAGRIIFIPNNYVFTRMIANYTHNSLKTVWDGIDIVVTFDSNHKKALHICKEITRKYSKGYTDITRKQLNKLRNNYSLKNTNVEPRIFSFIVPNGVVISSWYLTNAYGTLTLRSTISLEIVEELNKAHDITIAYPTQQLFIDSSERRMPLNME